MIQHLHNMIGTPNNAADLPDGRYVRAVPLPWYDGAIGRLRDAWAVFRGRAYAVEWPQPGELETALNPFEVFDKERRKDAERSHV